MFSPNFNDDVCRSRLAAMRAADYYLQQGHETFMFENMESGRAFVVTREMGLDVYLAHPSNKMVSYIHPDLYSRGNTIWHEGGHG